MPRVVTVLCHGTNFHRYLTGELVAEFGRCLAGKEIKASGIGTGVDLTGDFIVNEGPGSTSGKVDAATPGQVNPLLEVKKGEIAKYVNRKAIERSVNEELRRSGGYTKAKADALIKERTEFALHFYGEGLASNWAITGKMTGAGWDDNVHKTVGRIANLGQLPEVLNLLGWSRGGITCLKIANKMAEVFPQVRVNIFAIDPVYGGTDGGIVEDVKNVPETMRELWVILAMHERRKTFRPQVESMLAIHPSTQRWFLPMPGGHDQQVELTRGGPSAEVTWHLAYERLRQWGTRFKKAPIAPLSNLEVCRKYAAMSLRLDQYKAEGTTGITNWIVGTGFANRKFPRDRSLPSGYFINAHHWRCFQTQFPAAAKAFPGSGAEWRNEKVIRESIEQYFSEVKEPRKKPAQPAL